MHKLPKSSVKLLQVKINLAIIFNSTEEPSFCGPFVDIELRWEQEAIGNLGWRNFMTPGIVDLKPASNVRVVADSFINSD